MPHVRHLLIFTFALLAVFTDPLAGATSPLPETPQRGRAYPLQTRRLLPLGTTVLGQESLPISIPFLNSNGSTMSGLKATFTGPEADAFKVEMHDTVAPGQQIPLKITFRPFKTGPHGATMTLTWDRQSELPVEYFLGGTGAHGPEANLRINPLRRWSGTALCALPNGNLLLAGETASNYPGIAGQQIRELLPDGSETQRFSPYFFSNRILAMTLQPDGKLLVGGEFTGFSSGSFNLANIGLIRGGSLFRFNLDGSLDQSFRAPAFLSGPGTTPFFTQAIGVLPDGKILVGGEGPMGEYNHLVRLNADGSVDNTFPLRATDGPVHALAVQPDGRVIIGGAFTRLDAGATVADLGGLSRLNADGHVDTTFLNPGYILVSALATWRDQLAIAGLKASPQPSDLESGTRAVTPYVEVLDAAGIAQFRRELATSVIPATSSSAELRAQAPRALSMIEGGDVVVVHQPAASLRPRILQVPVFHLQNPFFGGTDPLVPTQAFEGDIRAVHAQRDGKVVIAGNMTASRRVFPQLVGLNAIESGPVAQPVPMNGFAQLNVDGFYPIQPVPNAFGLENYSDGLTTCMGVSPLTPVRVALPAIEGIFGSHVPKLEITGPDADQFTILRLNFFIIGQWPYFDPRVQPPSYMVVQSNATRPGLMRATLKMSDPLAGAEAENTFEVGLESRIHTGLLAGLEVQDADSHAPIPSGSVSSFTITDPSQVAVRSYRLKNTGENPLPLHISLTGENANDFELSGLYPTVLAPGVSFKLDVSFKATTLGRRDAVLSIFDSSDYSWHHEIRLQGEGVLPDGFAITPRAHIATEGEDVSLNAPTVRGGDISYQWFHNQKPLRGAMARTLLVPQTQIRNAGAYHVEILQNGRKLTSMPAQVAVIGQAEREIFYVAGKPLILNQPAEGNGLSFAWLFNGAPLASEPRFQGRLSQTLKLTNLQPSDAGEYRCVVSLGNVHLPGVQFRLRSLMAPIALDLPTQYAWKVGHPVNEQLLFSSPAPKFQIVGLPPGLKANPLTGQITGTPTRAGVYSLRISATNLAGTSEVHSASASVTPLGVYEEGTFLGLFKRVPELYQGRGGLVRLIVTSGGSYSGSLSAYTSATQRITHSFRGQLAWDEEGKAYAETTLPGLTVPQVLRIRLTDLEGSLFINGQKVGECRRVPPGTWENFSVNTHFIPVDADPALMATGYARATVTVRGTVTLTVKLATRKGMISFTASSQLCDDGNYVMLPLQAWLPHHETVSGWMPGTHGDSVLARGEIGWNADNHEAGEIRFQPHTKKHFQPSFQHSLLGEHGENNTLKITFATGETQFFMLNAKNQIKPGEGGLKTWLSPSFGRHLQTASINPKTGVFTASTWGRFVLGYILPHPDAVLPYGKIEGVTLTADDKIRGIFSSHDKSKPLAIPIEIEVVR